MTFRLIPAVIVATFLNAAFSNTVTADESWILTTTGKLENVGTINTLTQESTDAIPDEYGKREVHPVFEIRCRPGPDSTVSFRIDWRRFISSFNTEVGFRLDAGKTLWMKLGVNQTNRITLSKSAADVEKLVKKMIEGKTVEVEVSPYSEPSVTVRFDVSSFDARLVDLKESCQ